MLLLITFSQIVCSLILLTVGSPLTRYEDVGSVLTSLGLFSDYARCISLTLHYYTVHYTPNFPQAASLSRRDLDSQTSESAESDADKSKVMKKRSQISLSNRELEARLGEAQSLADDLIKNLRSGRDFLSRVPATGPPRLPAISNIADVLGGTPVEERARANFEADRKYHQDYIKAGVPLLEKFHAILSGNGRVDVKGIPELQELQETMEYVRSHGKEIPEGSKVMELVDGLKTTVEAARIR